MHPMGLMFSTEIPQDLLNGVPEKAAYEQVQQHNSQETKNIETKFLFAVKAYINLEINKGQQVVM